MTSYILKVLMIGSALLYVPTSYSSLKCAKRIVAKADNVQTVFNKIQKGACSKAIRKTRQTEAGKAYIKTQCSFYAWQVHGAYQLLTRNLPNATKRLESQCKRCKLKKGDLGSKICKSKQNGQYYIDQLAILKKDIKKEEERLAKIKKTKKTKIAEKKKVVPEQAANKTAILKPDSVPLPARSPYRRLLKYPPELPTASPRRSRAAAVKRTTVPKKERKRVPLPAHHPYRPILEYPPVIPVASPARNAT